MNVCDIYFGEFYIGYMKVKRLRFQRVKKPESVIYEHIFLRTLRQEVICMALS